MISVRHLSKTYTGSNPLTVLRDVNCEIEKGEVISIIGPSGTGKSTFLRCINKLETATSGQILIDGVDILDKKADIPAIRRKMGMVFQSFNLFENMTILENLCVGPIKILGMPRAEAEAQAMDLLRMVGMAEKAAYRPSALSGGQKQRVAIARCLSMKPEIILFDEPTSALDPTMVSEVLSVIRQLARQGMTMAIVTHEMQFARDVSTRVFFMYDGIIYEEGTPEQVFDNPQKPVTRAFIQKIRTLDFEVSSRDYDLYGMNSSIERFCYKYDIPQAVAQHAQHIVEELLAGILPLCGPVHLSLGYSEKTRQIELSAEQQGCTADILASADELSLTLIRGYADNLTETSIDGGRKLTMILKQ